MKTFTARQLNTKRNEIREAIKQGGCYIDYKKLDRSIDFKAVILPLEEYEKIKGIRVFR